VVAVLLSPDDRVIAQRRTVAGDGATTVCSSPPPMNCTSTPVRQLSSPATTAV
jgi:hypothetical protein